MIFRKWTLLASCFARFYSANAVPAPQGTSDVDGSQTGVPTACAAIASITDSLLSVSPMGELSDEIIYVRKQTLTHSSNAFRAGFSCHLMFDDNAQQTRPSFEVDQEPLRFCAIAKHSTLAEKPTGVVRSGSR